jgi:hypothetical protein
MTTQAYKGTAARANFITSIKNPELDIRDKKKRFKNYSF